MFVRKMCGFRDRPTLTHKVLGDSRVQRANAPPTAKRLNEVARENILPN